MTEAELKRHLDAAERNSKEIAAAVSGLSDRILRYKNLRRTSGALLKFWVIWRTLRLFTDTESGRC